MNFIIKCDQCKNNNCLECIKDIPIDSILKVRLKGNNETFKLRSFNSTIPCFCKHDKKDKLDYAIYKKVINQVKEEKYAMKLVDDIMILIKDYDLL